MKAREEPYKVVGLSTQEQRRLLEKKLLELELSFSARGHKSSEGDGRTAADIEREIKNGS